jgi:hypothetical protein
MQAIANRIKQLGTQISESKVEMLPSVNQSASRPRFQTSTSERKDAAVEKCGEGSGHPTFPLPSPSTGGAAAARAVREAGRSGGRLHGLGLEVRPPCPQEPFSGRFCAATGRQSAGQHQSKKLCLLERRGGSGNNRAVGRES